jgi:SAM-dependent methyltransferase
MGVTNYLLQAPVAYKLFLEKFDLPTTFGVDPNKLNIDDASADVFISSGTLEHVREDGVGREELILQDIYRVLKPGGLLFIWNLPTMLGTSELLAAVAGKWRHKYKYWRRDVTSLIENASFEIIFIEKHKFLPGAAMGPLCKVINPVTLMVLDDYLSRLFPFNVFARDFFVIARKPKSDKEDRK